MSYFGVSNPELNDPFYDIQAGYARRKSHQKQRYYSMGRMTIDQMAEQNRQKAAQSNAAVSNTAEGTTQKYGGYDLVTVYVDPLKIYHTSIARSGIRKASMKGNSKGESVNRAKSWVDKENAKNVDPSIKQAIQQAEYRPTTMPNDFIVGEYTVQAGYVPTLKQYLVSVRSGNKVISKSNFSQNEGQRALTQFNTYKSLSEKKAKWDLQVPRRQALLNYVVTLEVITASTVTKSISGLFDGILGMIGLGELPGGFQMPVKSFKIEVRDNDRVLVKESAIMNDYDEAVRAFDNEVSMLKNEPALYMRKPMPMPVPPTDGSGGDLTEPGNGTPPIHTMDIVFWKMEDGSIRQGSSHPRPAGAVSLVTEEDYRNWLDSLKPGPTPLPSPPTSRPPSTPPTGAPPADGDPRPPPIPVQKPPPQTQPILPGAPTPTPQPIIPPVAPAPPFEQEPSVPTITEPAENYNDMVKATPASTTQPAATSINTEMSDGDFYRTYNRSQEYQPTSTYQAQSTQIVPTAAAPSNNTSLMVGGALALAGAVYLSQNRK